MSLLERNRCQIEVKDKVLYSQTIRSVGNQISRNLASWNDWSSGGYAAAFDDAWKSGMRDHNAIVTYIMAVVGTKNSVGRIR